MYIFHGGGGAAAIEADEERFESFCSFAGTNGKQWKHGDEMM